MDKLKMNFIKLIVIFLVDLVCFLWCVQNLVPAMRSNVGKVGTEQSQTDKEAVASQTDNGAEASQTDNGAEVSELDEAEFNGIDDDEIERKIKEAMVRKGAGGSADTPNDMSQFEFTPSMDGTYMIITKYNGMDSKVQIPDLINGLPILEIEGGAFESTGVAEVILPDALIKIGSGAFSYCTELRKINVPSGLIHIDLGAFEDCSSLERFSTEDGKKCSLRYIESNAFLNCTSLKEVSLPGSSFQEVALGSGAFNSCERLNKLTLPKHIKYVEESTFENCKKLQSFDFSEVTKIGWYAFQNCRSLQKVELSGDVQEIGDGAFCGCHALSKITLKSRNLATDDEGASIGMEAFSGTGIASLTIPGQYMLLDSQFASDCKKLKKFIWKSTKRNKPEQRMGENPFANDRALKKIYLPMSIDSNYLEDWDLSTMGTFQVYIGKNEDLKKRMKEMGISTKEWSGV